MKGMKIASGVTLIVIGALGGLGIGFYFFTIGINAIKAKDTIRGLLHILLWAELAGGAFTLLVALPGVLILRSLDEDKQVEYSKGPEPQSKPSAENEQ